jgi:succinate dehydrogenase flavin-adding protein (antitoxin of CptAB toxin-antitoxin module)
MYCVNITEEEKQILMKCIETVNIEGYYDSYVNDLNRDIMKNFLKKLGCSDNDIMKIMREED